MRMVLSGVCLPLNGKKVLSSCKHSGGKMGTAGCQQNTLLLRDIDWGSGLVFNAWGRTVCPQSEKHASMRLASSGLLR